MSNDLLPCPFCGGQPQLTDIRPDGLSHQVGCSGCDFILNDFVSRDGAINFWNCRAQAAPVVTCNTATDNLARHNRAEELQLRLLHVVDLASKLATDAFNERRLDDPLESFVDAVLDSPVQHPSLEPLAAVLGQPGWDMEDWESQHDHDREVLQENAMIAACRGFFGIGVQFGTPVREFYPSGSYGYSWCYYNTVWIYADTLEEAWRIGCEWAEQKHRQARDKAGITDGVEP